MMRSLLIVCFVVFPLLGLADAPIMAQDMPKFEGTGIPLPPEQSQPWSAPKCNLPPELLSATTDLFTAGLSDPRGCEYREIVVPFRARPGWSPTADADAFKTHGWVLSAQAGESRRYAVCWNGLVYPLALVGPPADLDRDIRDLLAKDVAPTSDEMRLDPPRPLPGESMAFDRFTLIKLPLLLRLGK